MNTQRVLDWSGFAIALVFLVADLWNNNYGAIFPWAWIAMHYFFQLLPSNLEQKIVLTEQEFKERVEQEVNRVIENTTKSHN